MLPGTSRYYTDVPALFLAGSSMHPGDSASGRPARNPGRAVVDLDLDHGTVMSPTGAAARSAIAAAYSVAL